MPDLFHCHGCAGFSLQSIPPSYSSSSYSASLHLFILVPPPSGGPLSLSSTQAAPLLPRGCPQWAGSSHGAVRWCGWVEKAGRPMSWGSWEACLESSDMSIPEAQPNNNNTRPLPTLFKWKRSRIFLADRWDFGSSPVGTQGARQIQDTQVR